MKNIEKKINKLEKSLLEAGASPLDMVFEFDCFGDHEFCYLSDLTDIRITIVFSLVENCGLLFKSMMLKDFINIDAESLEIHISKLKYSPVKCKDLKDFLI
jgi:hypothetical protein